MTVNNDATAGWPCPYRFWHRDWLQPRRQMNKFISGCSCIAVMHHSRSHNCEQEITQYCMTLHGRHSCSHISHNCEQWTTSTTSYIVVRAKVTLVEIFNCIADTVEDSSSVRSYRISWKVKFLLPATNLWNKQTYDVIIICKKYHWVQ